MQDAIRNRNGSGLGTSRYQRTVDIELLGCAVVGKSKMRPGIQRWTAGPQQLLFRRAKDARNRRGTVSRTIEEIRTVGRHFFEDYGLPCQWHRRRIDPSFKLHGRGEL